MAIGAASLLAPATFHAMSGTIGSLNETRATGGGLLGAGFLVFLGAFRRSAATYSALLGSVLYLGYGFGRLVSTAVDPAPSGSLVSAMVVELALGLACVVAHRRSA